MNERIGKHGDYKPQLTVSGCPVLGACDTINLGDGLYAYLDTPRRPETSEAVETLRATLKPKSSNLARKVVLTRGETEHDDNNDEPTSKDV